MCLFYQQFLASDTDVLIDVPNDNGWYKGEIMYFNSRIGKYKVVFTDGDEDFIGIEEIDNIEIVLL